MPTSTLSKGIVQGWSPGETGWGDFMNANLKRINALLHGQWAQNIDTTVGLTYGYKGGVYASAGGLVTVPDGTLVLTANATNYVFRVGSVVSKSTVGFGAGTSVPMAIVETDISNIVSVTDVRLISQLTADGLLMLTGGLNLAGALQLADSNATIKLTDHLVVRNPADSTDIFTLNPDGTLELAGLLTSGGLVITGVINATGEVSTGGLDATELNRGVVPTGRIAGPYAGITQVGTLASLAVTGRAYTSRSSLGSSGSSKAIDWAAANIQALSVNANCTISFTNAAVGQQLLLELVAPTTPFALTWPGSVRWEDGIEPLLTGSNKTDLFAFYYNGTSFFGKVVGQGF